jgi:uncharacterized protein
LPHLSALQWAVAVAAAFGVGLSKGGLAGVGLFHVVVFALLFGARESTGVVLPLLLAADVCAVSVFTQHARWDYIRRMLPPACMGVIAAALFMGMLRESTYKPLIGWIVLVLAGMQAIRMRRPGWLGGVPHTPEAVWSIGLLAGATTMLANAAGPVVTVYCLAVGLAKFELVGTLAWFFFIINAFKVPFSAGLGLIRQETLLFNAILIPAVLAGVFGGRWLLHRLAQRLFNWLMLTFAAIAALKLIAG